MVVVVVVVDDEDEVVVVPLPQTTEKLFRPKTDWTVLPAEPPELVTIVISWTEEAKGTIGLVNPLIVAEPAEK